MLHLNEVQNDNYELDFWIPQMIWNEIENHLKNHRFNFIILRGTQHSIRMLSWYKLLKKKKKRKNKKL